MTKKIKKKKMPAPTVDPNLDDVDETRQKEIFYDEETNEVVITHHYRRNWGDGFDADVDELLDAEENAELIGVLSRLLLQQKTVIEANSVPLPKVSTKELQEGNPLVKFKNVNEGEKK